MAFSFDKALGSHQYALLIRARRMGYQASNLANADTPNYKARDIDFKAALSAARHGHDSMRMASTQRGHFQLAATGGMPGSEPLYRIPQQSSLDGNTVDVQKEQALFAENSVRYQATLRFLSGRFKGMVGALKGE